MEKTIEERLKEIEANELYQKTSALHKDYQFRQFTIENGKTIEGQQIREEDSKGTIEGEPGFDSSSKRSVIYNFVDGVLTDDEGLPAIQAPGHWEYWTNGMIKKIVDKGGDTEEYWENCVPVQIETGLAAKKN